MKLESTKGCSGQDNDSCRPTYVVSETRLNQVGGPFEGHP
jgi:hypothetical protein